MQLKSLIIICCCLTFFILQDCAGVQKKKLPPEYLGEWQRLPSSEISEQSDMQVDVKIVQDTVFFNQTVEGMNGIQRIMEKYRFEKSTQQNDSTINLFTVNTQTPAMITLTKRSNGDLSIVYCISNGNENADVDYTACNEWGNFSRQKNK